MLYQKTFFFLLKLSLSAGLAAYFFARADIGSLTGMLAGADKNFLAGALAVYTASLFIYSYKWQILAQAFGARLGFRRFWELNFIGQFYALFLPGGFLTGEAVKFYYAARGRAETGKLFLSVLYDRFSGAAAFIFLGAFSYAAARDFFPDITAGFLFLLGAAAMAVFLTATEPGAALVKRLPAVGRRLHGLMCEPARGQGFFSVYGRALAIGAFAHILTTIGFYLVVAALGYRLDFIVLLWQNALMTVATQLPVSILGLGLREFSLVYLFGLYGLPAEAALSAAVILAGILVVRGAIGGLVAMKYIFRPAPVR